MLYCSKICVALLILLFKKQTMIHNTAHDPFMLCFSMDMNLNLVIYWNLKKYIVCLVEGRRRGGRSLKGLSDRRKSQSLIELWRGSTPGNEPAKSNTCLSARFTSRQMSSSGVGLHIWRASPCFNVCDRGIWCFPLPNTYQMTILVSTQIQSKAKVGENFYWGNFGCVRSGNFEPAGRIDRVGSCHVTADIGIMCFHLSDIPPELMASFD